MLTAPLTSHSFDDKYDDDDWVAPPRAQLYRAASVGNSWGVTSIGRGFDWRKKEEQDENRPPEPSTLWGESSEPSNPELERHHLRCHNLVEDKRSPHSSPSMSTITPPSSKPPSNFSHEVTISSEPLSFSPAPSPTSSRPITPISVASSPGSYRPSLPRSQSSSRNSAYPRPRRRSSQQRVSLIAGRVSIAYIEPPSPPPKPSAHLIRSGSATSLLSVASSARAPTPGREGPGLPSERSISEFVIENEIGRGAYGLVKRAREMELDGSLGPPVVIKQVIKSRILADCWKRHPKYGTIPIEIYVMSSVSSTSYILPPRRPWDPSRLKDEPDDFWVEGKEVKGHPNICPLLDFFEDSNYYYLVMPSTTREPTELEPSPPSDLFDLVESYPDGLPPSEIRAYLGQIADALCFLHSKGIVHRDIKDENVVIGPGGRCVLIDFGSSGLVKKGGWDTFSGTLDYAGPEILRGERYEGKEQDVWAFGVVAYVMIVGECPFTTAAEAQEGLESPFSSASISLDERCSDGKEQDGLEADGGGALGDAAALVRACLNVNLAARPTFDKILESRFLSGKGGWGM